MAPVPSVVRHVAAAGLVAVIITNGHHKVQRDKLAACDAAELFPDPALIIVGGEEVLEGRPEKPAASIFMKACGVAAGHLALVHFSAHLLRTFCGMSLLSVTELPQNRYHRLS